MSTKGAVILAHKTTHTRFLRPPYYSLLSNISTIYFPLLLQRAAWQLDLLLLGPLLSLNVWGRECR